MAFLFTFRRSRPITATETPTKRNLEESTSDLQHQPATKKHKGNLEHQEITPTEQDDDQQANPDPGDALLKAIELGLDDEEESKTSPPIQEIDVANQEARTGHHSTALAAMDGFYGLLAFLLALVTAPNMPWLAHTRVTAARIIHLFSVRFASIFGSLMIIVTACVGG